MKKHKQKARIEAAPVQNKVKTEAIFEPNKLLIAALFIIPIIIYAFGFKNQFLKWDDHVYVSENLLLQEPIKNFGLILRSVFAGNFHPLTMLSLMLNMILFGKAATSFIVVNALIHALNTYLVFVFISKLLKIDIQIIYEKTAFYIAFFTALFFGIHPMHVESVVWISERKDVLYTCFFLLASIRYCDYLKSNDNKKLIWVLVFFVLSCLSKGMAVVLPVVLILIDYWSGKDLISFDRIKNKIPLFAFALFFGLLTLNVQGKGNFFGLIVNNESISAYASQYNFLEKIRFAGYALFIYVIKLFVPINLHHYYPYPLNATDYSTLINFGFVVSLALFFFWIFAIIRKLRIWVFGMGFMFVTLILVLQLISVGSAVLAERYTYIPYIGALFAIFYVLFNKVKKLALLISILSIIALLFTFQSISYVKKWTNTLAIWENTYVNGERNHQILFNLAVEYQKRGEYDKMLKICEEAISLNMANPMFTEFIGNYYSMNKDYTKSLEYYSKALTVPNFDKTVEKAEIAKIYLNQGIAYFNLGEVQNAIKSFQLSLANDNSIKNEVSIRKQRSGIYVNNKLYKEALDDCNFLIDKGIKTDTVYNVRAVANFSLGNSAAAITDLKTAVNINPSNAEAQNNLQKLTALTK